jgi:hypothetical protein
MIEGVSLINADCKHIYKCHSEFPPPRPLYNCYILIKKTKKKKKHNWKAMKGIKKIHVFLALF